MLQQKFDALAQYSFVYSLSASDSKIVKNSEAEEAMADKPSRSLVLFGDGFARFVDSSHTHFHSLASLSSCGFLSLPNSPPSGSLLLNPQPLCVCNNAKHTFQYLFSSICAPATFKFTWICSFQKAGMRGQLENLQCCWMHVTLILIWLDPFAQLLIFFFHHCDILSFLVRRGKSVMVIAKRIHQNKLCLIGILFICFPFSVLLFVKVKLMVLLVWINFSIASITVWVMDF